MEMEAKRVAVSSDAERLICVDTADRPTGTLSKGACHDGEGQLHRALSVFLFNSRGEVLLQQRSAQKRLWPLWWANSCCSHPREGEAVAGAAARRLSEELGVVAPLEFTHHFIYRARYLQVGSEYELCHVFVAGSDAEIAVHPNEVQATAWLSPEALDKALLDEDAHYTPWLRLEWATLRAHHWPRIAAVVAGVAGVAPGANVP